MPKFGRRDVSSKMVPLDGLGIIPERDAGKPPILDIRHLCVDFGGLRAVDDFTLLIGRTEIAGLIGPNGAGKTTVFNLLTNVYKPTQGRILLNGQDTRGKSMHELNRLGIARTFQNIRLFAGMTGEDNVKVGMSHGYTDGVFTDMFRLPGWWRTERRQHVRALELLDLFNLTDKADALAGNLPYGDQRRLEIVRALASEPKLLLLDEPAAGMNPSETHELMDNIRMLRDRFDIAIMLIEHDMNLVMGICEGIAVLNYGKIIAKGTPKEIQSNPVVIEAYLGEEAAK